MPQPAEITKAIGAHGMWKMRLKTAIDTGKSEFNPATVAVDNQCDFGKWLHSLPVAEKSTPEAIKIKDLHAKFHKEASAILQLALAGQKDKAQAAMATGTPFAIISADLTSALMKWKA